MKKMIPFILALLLLAGCSGKKQPSAETLDRDTLRAKAFEHAGVAQADAYDIDEDWDREGANTYYELDFEVNGVEYEYVLNGQTGEILRSSTDKKPASLQVDSTPQQISTEPQLISEEEAKRIALEDAGLTEGAVKSYSIELEMDEYKYEIQFFTKGIEYEYDIDARTGEILEKDKDRD